MACWRSGVLASLSRKRPRVQVPYRPYLMKKIDKLYATQNDVRRVERLLDMAIYVRNKGYFNREALNAHALERLTPEQREQGVQPREAPLIQIYRLTDPTGVDPKRCYVHDGHHRVTAVCLGGRRYLRKDEYELHDWTYEDYMQINFDYMYVTPYDPRIECRLPDTCSFKREARRLAEQDKEAATAFILANADKYRCPRWIGTIKELRNEAIKALSLKGIQIPHPHIGGKRVESVIVEGQELTCVAKKSE